MANSTPVRLLFDDSVLPIVRSRIDYAFRVFAAVYGHRVCAAAEDHPGVRTFVYGETPATQSHLSSRVRIPAKYAPQFPVTKSPEKVRYANEDIYHLHGLDPTSGQPDWLGEIFEWLSGSWERNISARDSVGRIPDQEAVFARYSLPTWKPQAALHMAWLEHYSLNGLTHAEFLPKAPSPVESIEHLVVCSHDVDFYFTNRADAFLRIFKNFGIAFLLYRDASYFTANARLLGKALRGNRVGEYLPPLISRLKNAGVKSTFFVVPVHEHRRDPNYALSDLASAIGIAKEHSFPIELHASYTSIVNKSSLKPELATLKTVVSSAPTGSRQHWLRFGDQQELFQAVQEAGLLFDSSVGFTEAVGFRSGACFAFPPYDFEDEKPFEFLEIPLAIMDGSLIDASRATGQSAKSLADEVLSESRKRGWGGISILWHNPLEALSVPDSINKVFWDCAEDRNRYQEQWVDTTQFLSLCLKRYQDAGLLTNASGSRCLNAV